MDERPFTEATREAACRALQTFLPHAGAHYASRRNFDPGPGDRRTVSRLSGYIRHRLVLEAEVLEAVLQHHGEAGASRFIEEIFWRGYFKGWLEQHPTVWTDYRATVRGLVDTLETKGDLRDRYEAAVNAATGIDCFDAWAAELVTTGYLHNHARMWFASIWVYTLGLPWQLGADFFYRHLVDGDPASNTLGWRWICGLHTKGKTYLARASNIVACTGGRFDPGGRLAYEAPPLKEAQIHSLRALPEAEAIPAGARFGLLITEEDCTPETLVTGCSPVAVMAGVTTSSRSPLPVGAPAREFAIGAVADATERAARHFGVPAQSVQSGDWDDALVAWARSSELDAVVTAYAPVGPVAERVASARRALADRGVALVQLRRAYDSCTWPHAAGGYFKLKSRIPGLLRALGLAVAEPASQRAAG
ncbi:MAG TPA: FAD-binding domain-containing protein [Woeseiaceae bacterium]|nr:FAD-binding domain-containing protein [Woeseiaceae bacterium]